MSGDDKAIFRGCFALAALTVGALAGSVLAALCIRVFLWTLGVGRP